MSSDEIAEFTVELAKEDFKFSAAHFTLFDAECGELLHGHNYRVAVSVSGPRLDRLELLCDLRSLKDHIRTLCAELDSLMLLPERSPYLELEARDGSLAVRFQDRSYLFPRAEVLLLPLRNTSVEALARWLWWRLAGGLDAERIERLEVAVQETSGQRCSFRAPVSSRGAVEAALRGEDR